MKIKLEQIIVCVYHLKAMRNIAFNKDDEKCRKCESANYESCEHYRPYSSSSQIPINQGSIAYRLRK